MSNGEAVYCKFECAHREPAELIPPMGGFFYSVKGGSLWTAGVYEVLSLSWRHRDTHIHTLSLSYTQTTQLVSLFTKALFVYLATKHCQ